jgi:hypothetical protein
MTYLIGNLKAKVLPHDYMPAASKFLVQFQLIIKKNLFLISKLMPNLPFFSYLDVIADFNVLPGKFLQCNGNDVHNIVLLLKEYWVKTKENLRIAKDMSSLHFPFEGLAALCTVESLLDDSVFIAHFNFTFTLTQFYAYLKLPLTPSSNS